MLGEKLVKIHLPLPLGYWGSILGDFRNLSQLLDFMGWESNSFRAVVLTAFPSSFCI